MEKYIDRSERNRYKEDAKRLSARLDSQLQEMAELRRETEHFRCSMVSDYPNSPSSQQENSIKNMTSMCQTVSISTADAAVATEELDLTVTSANLPACSPPSIDSGVNQTSFEGDPGSPSANTKFMGQFLEDAVSSLSSPLSEQQQTNALRFRLEEAMKTVEAERR